MYQALFRVLSRLDAERVHGATLALLRFAGAVPPLRGLLGAFRPASDPVTVMGITFPNRIGLAAGYDKNAIALRGLAALGIGHVEVGTVTPLPQRGNDRPRVHRMVGQQAVVNSMGFPSDGASEVATRLANRPDDLVVGVNIGKNAATPLDDAAADYVAVFDALAPLADYITVNVSSPNTPGLRSLATTESLRPLLAALTERRDAVAQPVPIAVKVSPDMSAGDLGDVVAVAVDTGIDGIVATNTTVARTDVDTALPGGVSGAPLRARASAALEQLVDVVDGRLALIASGGVMTPQDVAYRIATGADLVQLYTGLVYAGPGLLRKV